MRFRRPVLLAITGAVAAALLAGCTSPSPSPTPTPKATPLYSSDAEALAAAQKAWTRYADVSNEIAQSGWSDLSALSTVATGDALSADRRVAKSSRDSGLRVIGSATGSVKKVEDITERNVVAYACINVSQTHVIDSSGNDVTPAGRVDDQPFEVTFVPKSGQLIVERNDKWSGDSFC